MNNKTEKNIKKTIEVLTDQLLDSVKHNSTQLTNNKLHTLEKLTHILHSLKYQQ